MASRTMDEIYVDAPLDVVHRSVLAATTGDAPWWPGARVERDGERMRAEMPTGRPFSRVRFAATITSVRPDGMTWILDEGELHGRAEWWFERFKDGTIVHYYLDVHRAPRRRRRIASSVRRHRWAIRRGLNALKDELERRAPARTEGAR